MEQYVGLDVSLKETHFCVVDGSGAVLARGREATQPELLAAALARHASAARVVVLQKCGDTIRISFPSVALAAKSHRNRYCVPAFPP